MDAEQEHGEEQRRQHRGHKQLQSSDHLGQEAQGDQGAGQRTQVDAGASDLFADYRTAIGIMIGPTGCEQAGRRMISAGRAGTDLRRRR